MKRHWKIGVSILSIATAVGFCSGLTLYLLHDLRMRNKPARIFSSYHAELRQYIQQLESDDVHSEEGQAYPIPPFLIDHGARYVRKEGDCFVIIFSFMPTDAVPELWYSPQGFEPLPQGLVDRKGRLYFRFQQLAPEWGECFWDQ
jgi:hypothetical protein